MSYLIRNPRRAIVALLTALAATAAAVGSSQSSPAPT
jgi:hypothetical protein